MSRFQCERWASIVDRRLLGDLPDATDARFEAEHAATCQECGRERGRWAELALLPPSQVRVPPAGPLTDALRARIAPQRVAAPARQPWPWVIALAAAAAAVALVLHRAPPPIPQPTVEQARSSAFLLTSNSSDEPAAVSEGTWLRAATTPLCLFIEPGVRACLAAGAEATVSDLRLASRRLSLVRGRVSVSLDPQPPGTTFTVATRDGEVSAIGTLFSVEVPAGSEPVSAYVLHGAVRVSGSSGKVATLRAAQRASVAEPRPRAFEGSDEQRLLAETRLSELIGRPDDPVIDVAVAPAHAVIAVDGTPAGRGQIALRLPPGPHTIVASADGHDSWTERIEAQPGVAIRRVQTLTLTQEPAAPVRRAAEAAPVGRWLTEARRKRARGDYAGAAALYRRVHAAGPRTTEGCTAVLALAELQVTKLGAPAAALRSFEDYLGCGDDVLTTEAELGRIRALRQLGRGAEERSAIENFIERYPSSVGITGLRQRLRELGPPL